MGITKKTIQIGQQPTAEALEEVKQATKKKIVYDADSPKLSEMELKEFVSATELYYRPKKEQITLKIDADVLAAFKSTGKGYQTRINSALRKAIFS